MKLDKITAVISKAILSRETEIKHTTLTEKYRSVDVIAVDYWIVFYIESCDFIVDIEKADLVHRFFESELTIDSKKLVNGEITNQVKIYDKKEYIKILSDKCSVWINRKLLKFFDEKCDFKVASDSTEVFIYENSRIVGRIKSFKED